MYFYYASAAKRAKASCSRAVRPAVRPSVRSCINFLYYANMVQQIEFIIYTNIQTLQQKFFTKRQGQRSKVQKNVLLTR